MQIQPAYEPLLRGFIAARVFDSAHVVVWRKLDDRENCTLDTVWPDGRAVRLHVKRYPARWAAVAETESRALLDLQQAGIACASLAAWGKLGDGRAFIMTEDLTGYEPADKLIARGEAFEKIAAPTAELAAKLHSAGFHHRDLYLCHFMVKTGGEMQVKLIDAARVRRLPAWPLRRRWIVKDLAQFWFSMTQLSIADSLRADWLAKYSAARKISENLRGSVEAKSRRIAAHDVNLNRREPERHVSIPSQPS
jgi:Lipopolysaccharide kinase (Kdo/WaaP) family